MRLLTVAITLAGATLQDPAPPAAQPLENLIEALSSDVPETREKATMALIARGQEARSAVESATSSSDPEVSARASFVLSCLDWRISAELAQRDGALAGLMTSGSVEEQRRRIREMAAAKDVPPDACTFLEEVDRRESLDPWVRWTARLALARAGRAGVWPLPPIACKDEPLNDEDLSALVKKPSGEPIARAVRLALGHRDIPARWRAFVALIRISGRECATLPEKTEDLAAIPSILKARIIRSGMKRWATWWERHKKELQETPGMPLDNLPGGLTAEDVWVEALLPAIGTMTPRFDHEGRIIALSDGEGEIHLTYDVATNRMTESFDKRGRAFMKWDYDEKGLLSTEVYGTDDAQWRVTYLGGQLESVRDSRGETLLRITPPAQEFEYDSSGRIIKKPEKDQ